MVKVNEGKQVHLNLAAGWVLHYYHKERKERRKQKAALAVLGSRGGTPPELAGEDARATRGRESRTMSRCAPVPRPCIFVVHFLQDDF